MCVWGRVCVWGGVHEVCVCGVITALGLQHSLFEQCLDMTEIVVLHTACYTSPHSGQLLVL